MLSTINLQAWKEEKGNAPRKSCSSLDDPQSPFCPPPPPKFVFPSFRKISPSPYLIFSQRSAPPPWREDTMFFWPYILFLGSFCLLLALEPFCFSRSALCSVFRFWPFPSSNAALLRDTYPVWGMYPLRETISIKCIKCLGYVFAPWHLN